jgi:hypothetical protein
LRNEKLQIVSEYAVEIWIHPALLQILDGIRLVCIHSDQRLGNKLSFLLLAHPRLEVYPFLKSFDECLFGNRFRLLTANAATETIVTATADSE